MELRISVEIHDSQYSGTGNLHLSQNCTLPNLAFDQIAKIMTRVHELFEELKRQAVA